MARPVLISILLAACADAPSISDPLDTAVPDPAVDTADTAIEDGTDDVPDPMLLELGDACDADDTCDSGRCIDGVCCAELCDGPCLACSIAAGGQSDGMCTPAFVDTVEPGVCDASGGDCGDEGCACDDTGTCVADFLAEIDVGGVSTCARWAAGKLRCWGGNVQGQLGLEDRDNRGDDPDELGMALPAVDLGADRTVTSVAAGSRFNC
ncbi:MAG: hypothetical protein AAF211_11785, partial [Myxococcota bacterium]